MVESYLYPKEDFQQLGKIGIDNVYKCSQFFPSLFPVFKKRSSAITGRVFINGTMEGEKWKKKAVLDNDLVHRISLEEDQREEREGKSLGPQGLNINKHGQIVDTKTKKNTLLADKQPEDGKI